MTPVIISTCDIFFFDLEVEMFLWTQQLETRNAQADFAIAALAADGWTRNRQLSLTQLW